MLDHALSYARRGWSVIPVRPRDKRPSLASWREYQEQRATEEEIREWWNRRPDANIGIVTGRVSNLVVLDLDGPDAVAFIKERGIPETPVVATGKGFHVYFAHPGRPVANAATLGGVKGVDVRGDGGYVVAPPSVHPSGRRYVWTKDRPLDLPLALPPEWLLRLLDARGQLAAGEPGGREPGWVERLLAGVPEGQRDDACTRLAGHFLSKGLPEGEVLALLLAWNQKNQPPLPERDVEKCVRSVARREAAKPPRPPVPVNFRLEGPVYAPEGWRTLVICRDWQQARRLAAVGNAVVVHRGNGSLPTGAAKLVAEAQEVKTAGFTQEEARKLVWLLYPLRVMREAAAAATGGAAALDPASVPELSRGAEAEAAARSACVPPAPESAPEPEDSLSPFGFALSGLPGVASATPGSPVDSPDQGADARETLENAPHLGRGGVSADRLFPYPLPETLGIGTVDPLDYRYVDGKVVYDPGWWRFLLRRKISESWEVC